MPPRTLPMPIAPLALVTLLTLLAPAAGRSQVGSRLEPAATPSASSYLVLDIDEAGTVTSVFQRQVELAAQPASRSLEDLPVLQRTALRRPDDVLEVGVEDGRGVLVFRDVVEVPRFIRGEFHRQPGHDSVIDGYRFPRSRRAFVLRLPGVEQGQLVLDGKDRQILPISASSLQQRAAIPTGQQASVVRASGSSANRLDLLIMGDGYTAAEASKFQSDVTALEASFFAITPYAEYADYVNVTSLFTPSSQSGADHPPYNAGCTGDNPACCADTTALGDPKANTYVNTAFDGRFCSFQIHRLLVVDATKVLTAAAAVPDWDRILVLVNDSTYGGSGGQPGVLSTHPSAVAVAQHEFGHSFTGLADEYESAFPGFPACTDVGAGPDCEPNMTDETNPGLIKWAPWIDAGTPVPTPEGNVLYLGEVGLFEGGRYLTSGIYRPRDHQCIMRSLGQPFCEICAQEYLRRLYIGQWGSGTAPAFGIDLIEPGSIDPPGTTTFNAGPGGITLSFDLLEPAGGVDVEWLLDNVVLPGAGGSSFHFAPAAAGMYEVSVILRDNSPLVHPGMRPSQMNDAWLWRIDAAGNPGIFGDGFESGNTNAWDGMVP